MKIIGEAIRVSSFAFGSMIIVASVPLALLAGAVPSDTVSTLSSLFVIPLVACVIASGFLYVGILGQNLTKTSARRVCAGLMLTVPILLGIRLVMDPVHKEMHMLGFVLFFAAITVFVAAVWPCVFRAAGAPEE